MAWLLLAGCVTSNDCLDLCQQYELHLEECGYGWSTTFESEGWTSIEDCYDTYWEVNSDQENWCEKESSSVAVADCY